MLESNPLKSIIIIIIIIVIIIILIIIIIIMMLVRRLAVEGRLDAPLGRDKAGSTPIWEAEPYVHSPRPASITGKSITQRHIRL